jgi:hypothetical protein
MDSCMGVYDWLECTSCSHLCTARCPIEGQDALAKLSKKIQSIPGVNPANIELDGIVVDTKKKD